MASLAPRALTPARLGRPWGGRRFGMAGEEPVGELWVSGDDARLPDGRTLAAAGLASSVPLVKVLDIGAQLSIQVHPDDALATELQGLEAVGKHEAWVVLEAEPGAEIPIGLVDADRVADLFSGDRAMIAAALGSQPAVPGLVIDVAPGTVHAPAAGVLLYEVQQRSDLTYRIFDWGRSRQVHLNEARRAIRADVPIPVTTMSGDEGRHALVQPPAPFRLELVRPGAGGLDIHLEGAAVLSIIRGEITVDGLTVAIGDHVLLDAGDGSVTGSGEALLALWR